MGGGSKTEKVRYKPAGGGDVRTTLLITPEQRRALDEAAAKRKTTISNVARGVFDAWMKRRAKSG